MIKLDVVLIYLPKPHLKQPNAQAPLGLMYIASSLEEKNKKVIIENYASLSDDEAIEKIPNAVLFGITITSLEVLQANRFAKKIKLKYPHAKIVLGGPGTYAVEFIDFSIINSICQGDGEYTIHKILEDAINKNMKKIYIGEIVKNLDILPLPSRHLLTDSQGGDIFAYGKHYADGDSTIILSSRGCAFQCAFCSAPVLTYSKKLRFRSPQKVAEEIDFVKKNYGIKQFRFSDDMFSSSEKRTLEMCEAIGPLNVFWRISCRVKPITGNMLKAMKNAGCVELSFGIESFSNDVLKILRKNATCEDNVKALELSNKYGFSTRILMMVRTPGQTKKTIEENKYWIKKVPFDIIANTAFIPIPGCEIWYHPERFNIEILDKDLDKYNFYMYNDKGRRKIDPIINIIGRDIDDYHKESEEFRDFLEEMGKINKG